MAATTRHCSRGLRQILAFRRLRCRPFSVSSVKCGSANDATITVTPGEALMDEKLHIRVTGLQKSQPITVRASLTENKADYASCASYLADDTGIVDLNTHSAIQGTYQGVEPMGLFWSMVPAPGQKKGLRLMKRDVTSPFDVNLEIFSGQIPFDDLHQQSVTPMTRTVVKRWYKAANVTRQDVRESGVTGTLFLPPGNGPFPGVIDMFGSTGGLVEYRASLLASRGFATLSLPYFMFENLPQHMRDLKLEYFMNAVDWLSTHPTVTPGGIGVVGVSMGGALALLMAVHCPMVKAAVCISGTPFYIFCNLNYGDGIIDGVELDGSRIEQTDEGFRIKHTFPYERKHIIEVWKSKAKYLALVGADDQNVNPEVQYALYDLIPDEKKADYEIVCYPKAGHLIEPPYSPLCRTSFHKLIDDNLLWGGYSKEHAFAQEDAWRRLRNFLWENLTDGSRRVNKCHL